MKLEKLLETIAAYIANIRSISEKCQKHLMICLLKKYYFHNGKNHYLFIQAEHNKMQTIMPQLIVILRFLYTAKRN